MNGRLQGVIYLSSCCVRLVRTEWIAGQRITCECEGPRTGPAAYRGVFASTTFALELSRRMQSTKKCRVTINIYEVIAAHIARRERQEARWVNVTLIGNKHDAVAIADPKSTIDRALRDFIRRSASFLHSLERHTTKRRSLGRLDLEGRSFRDIEYPIHTFFALFPS